MALKLDRVIPPTPSIPTPKPETLVRLDLDTAELLIYGPSVHVSYKRVKAVEVVQY